MLRWPHIDRMNDDRVFVMTTSTSTKLTLAAGCMLLILAAAMIAPVRTQGNPTPTPHTREATDSVNPFLVGGLMVVLVIGGAILPMVTMNAGRRFPQPTPPPGHKIIPFPVQARATARQPRAAAWTTYSGTDRLR